MSNQDLTTLVVSCSEGYKKPQGVQRKYFQDRLTALSKMCSTFEAMLTEQYIFDDLLRLRHCPDVDRFLEYIVMSCDTLICTDENSIVGIAMFSKIIPGRSAEFVGWVDPEYRAGNFIGQRKVKSFLEDDIPDHAWNVLNLIRLEAKCAVENTPAIRFAKNMGFSHVGTLALDFMFFDQLYDSVLLELINPAYRLDPIEVKSHGWKRTEGTRSEHDGDDDGEIAAIDLVAAGDGSDWDSGS